VLDHQQEKTTTFTRARSSFIQILLPSFREHSNANSTFVPKSSKEP